MPITKSAIKRVRQSKVRAERNEIVKLRIKNLLKKIKKASAGGNQAEIDKLMKEAYAAIDKAVGKNVIHKNTAARKKSRLVKSVNPKARQ